MKKLFFLLIGIYLFKLLTPGNVSADEYFYVDNDSSYSIDEGGKTFVVNNIYIENKYTEKYSLVYYLSLANVTPYDIEVYEAGKRLDFRQDSKDNNTVLTINFDDKVVGKGKSRQLRITYSLKEIAQKTGGVWEISIPKVSSANLFRNYTMSVSVPKSFGDEAFLSPYPINITDNGNFKTYYYDKNIIGDSALVLGFGEFQVFSFSLNYYLENNKNYSSIVTAPIPPDTAYQRMYYERINPVPSNVKIDGDGNWIAEFTLKAKERKNVKVEGSVQLFANPRKLLVPQAVDLFNNIKARQYWEADDPQIVAIAKELKTPSNIYNFVVDTLKYNNNRKNSDEVLRYGAKEALANPTNATCMEFTDLFIAITRAAGIPAREINGFAYTENSEIQPLSLIRDVLHSWPEYWNDELKSWIPVDPTWQSTSKIDYFSKFDLRHFTFVIHGDSSTSPLSPGFYREEGNRQKNIFVNLGQLPPRKGDNLTISSSFKDNFIFTRNINISVKNLTGVTKYDTKLAVNFDQIQHDQKYIAVLPPYSEQLIKESVPFTIFARSTPKEIGISTDNNNYRFDGPFNNDLTLQLLIFFIVISLLVLLIFKKYLRKANHD